MSIFKKGFRKQKKPTIKQLAKRQGDEDFINGYKDLCNEHSRKLDIIHDFSKEEGLKALLAVVDHTPKVEPKTEVKPWSEAKQDNFDLRSSCEHELNKEAVDGIEGAKAFCVKCRLPMEDWDGDDRGYNREAREKALESINREKDKEEALKN